MSVGEELDFSVIVPTLNEESNICELLDGIIDSFSQNRVEKFEIFIVDDNSTDKTVENIRKYSSKSIHLIERPRKMGIGSAYKDAFPQTKGKNIIIMDADLSHPPRKIKEFCDAASKINDEKYYVITSTRYNKGGKVVGWSPKRILISKVANTLARFVLRIKSSDVTGSYRLYSRPLFEKIAEKSASNGFNFQLEAIFLATRYKARIEEVPITFVDRRKGVSKLNFMEIVNFCFTVARLFLLMIFIRFC